MALSIASVVEGSMLPGTVGNGGVPVCVSVLMVFLFLPMYVLV